MSEKLEENSEFLRKKAKIKQIIDVAKRCHPLQTKIDGTLDEIWEVLAQKGECPEFNDGDLVRYKGVICKIIDGKIESNVTGMEKMRNLEKRLT